MQLPKFLSSFPQTIFRSSSKFSKDTRIIEINNERRLLVNGIIQSVYPLDNNWQRFENRCWGIMKSLATVNLSQTDKKQVLLLGLAGGTVIHLLNQAFSDVKITAIEIDKELIDAGKKYFFLDQFENLEIINSDARNLPTFAKATVGKPDQCYNVIINDLFSSERSPDFVDDEGFLLQLHGRLKTDGLLICNRIFKEREINEREGFLKKLKEIFGNADVVEVKSQCSVKNYVFFATPCHPGAPSERSKAERVEGR